MDLDTILLEAEEAMDKAINYLKHEMQGIRTGRASTSLVEFVKIDYYGSPTDLRQIALISVSDATQLVIKPFDASTMQSIVKGLQTAGLGLNPVADGKQIRINIPSLSGERRKQLVASVKQMGEQAKVTVRNARRDANKHIDAVGKDKSQAISEDAIDAAKEDVQDLLKKYEGQIEELVKHKSTEIEEV